MVTGPQNVIQVDVLQVIVHIIQQLVTLGTYKSGSMLELSLWVLQPRTSKPGNRG